MRANYYFLSEYVKVYNMAVAEATARAKDDNSIEVLIIKERKLFSLQFMRPDMATFCFNATLKYGGVCSLLKRAQIFKGKEESLIL